MSSMLEQAIVDAAALREAALKNAEQAIIEKYAPQIKEAVDSMLETEVNENHWVQNQLVQHEGKFARITTESDGGKVGIQYIGEEKTNLVTESELQGADEALLQEEEGMSMGGGSEAAAAPNAVSNIPYAAGISPDGEVSAKMNVYDFSPEDFDIDLENMFLSQGETEELTTQPEEAEVTDDLDLDLSSLETPEEDAVGAPATGDAGAEPEADDDEGLLFQELLDILSEELTVDMGETKQGHITTDEGTLKYEQEKALAEAEDDEKKEEDEEYNKKIEELDETVRKQALQMKDLLKIVDELSSSLNETLLSNAKLLYCNKTLSDASLNERQKNKIVEAIASANTPDEAKTLQETLKATVGSTKRKGPQSLSESVNRKSNLSGIMPRRKQTSAQQFTFAEHMKKLAGIK